MKTSLKTVAALILLSGVSQAAVAISGSAGSSFKQTDGATNIPLGALFLTIVDTGTSGFLATASTSALVPVASALTSLSDPGLKVPDVSITLGGTFGGDTILGVGSVGNSGSISGLLSSTSIVGYENKSFALVWFEKSAATLTTEGLANQKYGIIRGADWTLPATDSGNFTMSATDANVATSFYSFSATISAAQRGTTGFFTGSGTAGDATADVRSTTFTIATAIPEPSSAAVGMLVGLGMLVRRRRD